MFWGDFGGFDGISPFIQGECMDLRTYLDYPGGEDLKHSNSALKGVQ